MNSIRLNKEASISISKADGCEQIYAINELLNINEKYNKISFNIKSDHTVFNKINERLSNKINPIKVELYKLPEARIVVYPGIDGIIITKDNKFIKEQIKYFRPGIFNKFFFDLSSTSEIPYYEKEEDVFLSFDASWRNYYHLLVLTLPKLFLAQKINTKINFVLPDPKNKIKGNDTIPSFSTETLQEILKASPIEQKRINYWTPGIYKVNHLYFIKIIGKQHDYIYSCNLQKFFNQFDTSFTDASKNEKIFLSRKNSRNKRPIDFHYQKYERIYRKKDYKIVLPDTLSWKEQVQLFNNSASIAGFHGAGFTNLLFSKRKANTVTEINSLTGKEKTLRPHFFNIAKAKNFTYESIYIDLSKNK